MFATVKTLYDYIISNSCFSGEQSGLPVEVSRRVFELVVFDGIGDSSLSNIIILMLMTCEDKVVKMDMATRFHYIGHGNFIKEIFEDEKLFKQLFSKLKHDCDLLVSDEMAMSRMTVQSMNDLEHSM